MLLRLSLLIFCCALTGVDALEVDKSADPWQEKIALTGAPALDKPDKEADMREADQQPPRRDASLEGEVAPTAEALEDEVDKQESFISQVSYFNLQNSCLQQTQ